MVTIKNEKNIDELESEEEWFFDYIANFDKVVDQDHKKFGDYFLCSCYGYPTLA